MGCCLVTTREFITTQGCAGSSDHSQKACIVHNRVIQLGRHCEVPSQQQHSMRFGNRAPKDSALRVCGTDTLRWFRTQGNTFRWINGENIPKLSQTAVVSNTAPVQQLFERPSNKACLLPCKTVGWHQKCTMIVFESHAASSTSRSHGLRNVPTNYKNLPGTASHTWQNPQCLLHTPYTLH